MTEEEAYKELEKDGVKVGHWGFSLAIRHGLRQALERSGMTYEEMHGYIVDEVDRRIEESFLEGNNPDFVATEDETLCLGEVYGSDEEVLFTYDPIHWPEGEPR